MKQYKSAIMVAGLVLIVGVCAYFKFATSSVQTLGLSTTSKVIVIDPGHGGYDPGKVGIKGSHEKDINLAIALKLKDYLEESGAKVVMTRTQDEDLDGLPDKFNKNSDMRARKEIINGSGADILISIHQNAFTQPEVRGAQVFYYNESNNAKALANNVQTSITENADANNKRKIKSTENYYVLKVSTMPGIIIECGFLTNPEEAAALNSKEYQDKMAWSIYAGIVKYFQQVEGAQS